MGSALTYKMMYGDELALKVAAITKLSRNLCLAGVIPYLAWAHAKESGEAPKTFALKDLSKFVPLFVVGFVGMACVRSTGDMMLANDGLALGIMDAAQWKKTTSYLGGTMGTALLGTAMAGVGLNTSAKVLIGHFAVQPYT